MDNATKALLIAASVLIVIVLISMGIQLLSSTKGVADQVEATSSNLSVSIFNAQFEQFFGSKITSAQACSLVSKIYMNNSQDPSHIVRVCLRNNSGKKLIYAHDQNTIDDLQQAVQMIHSNISSKNKMTYTIKVSPVCIHASTPNGPGYNNGYIVCISIQENS